MVNFISRIDDGIWVTPGSFNTFLGFLWAYLGGHIEGPCNDNSEMRVVK